MQEDLFPEDDARDIDRLSRILEEAQLVYLKRLALNDWQWSQNQAAHQAGVYVPHEDRDNLQFFPALNRKERDKGEEIREVFFDIRWVQVDQTKQARLVNYRSKGEETHLTRLPKECFADLHPASFLLIARSGERFAAMVIDSTSAAVDVLQDAFDIGSMFRSAFFEPATKVDQHRRLVLDFVEQAIEAFQKGRLNEFAATHAAIPSTLELAERAQRIYLNSEKRSDLDPFTTERPGDVLMRLSRDIEYGLFKEHQLRARSLELVSLILGDDPSAATVQKAIGRIITRYSDIDKVLLSAAQQRKSRAGYSFEHHISRMLADGKIPFQEQIVVKARKRPDFVLPSGELYSDTTRTSQEALVLSAKTTLRERWKQVHGEIKNCVLYLATVDDSIAGNAVDDMASQGIRLVVPESLKDSDTTVYKRIANVISFRQFFDEDIRGQRWALWLKRGLVA